MDCLIQAEPRYNHSANSSRFLTYPQKTGTFNDAFVIPILWLLPLIQRFSRWVEALDIEDVHFLHRDGWADPKSHRPSSV